ncbi:ABC transporter permease [Methanocella sp. CWC-04]|uniref:ABC transporter permease n=1 Tax=Methanooceanicella nereidis TaxID=2052831 RepID=A0AAP2W633_9EURY|nr:ABC transporter permease subunit [Methanocella sp. CWC-04]MCD1293681.1 ABC transporter permease [Methanocella sp. CWC-04]
MSFNIFRQSIKDKARGAIIATLIISGFVFFMGSMFPEAKKMSGAYDEMLQNPAFKAMIGDSITSLSTFEGFMSAELYSYMGLIIGCYVAFLTASFIAGEIENRTADLLLSLPVSRAGIVISRYMALIPVVTLFVLGLVGSAVISAAYINVPVDIVWFAYAGLSFIILGLATGAISMLVSSFLSDSKQSAIISIGIFVLMYFTETIGSMSSSLDTISVLSIFHYVDTPAMLISHTSNLADLGVLVAMTILILALAVLNFQRRDINFA